MRRRRALTLVEMLVSCFLFFLFITLSGEMIVYMLDNYRKGEAIVRPLQAARNAMDLMTQACRSTDQILSPLASTLALGSDTILMHVYTPLEPLRCLEFKAAGSALVETVYPFGIKGPPDPPRVLSSQLSKLLFVKQTNDLVITVELMISDPTPLDLKTMVFIRPRQGF